MENISSYLSIISAHDASINQSVSCREWLALIATYLLQQKAIFNDNSNLSVLLKETKKYVLDKKNESEETLNSQSFGELCSVVYSKWASRLDDRTTMFFCNSISKQMKLIESYEEGYISFNNMLFGAYLKIQKVRTVPVELYEWQRNTYSTKEDFEPAQKALVPSPAEIPLDEKTELNNSMKEEAESNIISYTPKQKIHVKDFKDEEADDELDTFWDNLSRRKAFNISIPYFWQLNISKEEYKQLKGKLSACISAHQDDTKTKLLRRHALPIACYVAEYYKREYCGNDGQENELQKMGLPDNYDKIIHAAGIDEQYIYVSQNETHMWQDSLRMLGGLPINYIADKNRFSNILSTLISVYQDSDTEYNDEEQLNQFEERLNSLTNGISGVALTGSIKNHHSIYEYVRALLSDELPIAEEDVDDETFVRFKDILEEVRKKLRKKFQWQWSLYHDETTIYPELKIAFSGKDPQEEYSHYISPERLSSWGIPSTSLPDTFWLSIRFVYQDVVILDIRDLAYFSFNGTHYIYWGGSKSISCSHLPESAFDKVECYLIIDDKEYQIPETYDYPGYIQVYQMENPYLWESTRREASSAIVYDTNLWVLSKNDGEDKILSWNEQTPSFVWSHIKNREIELRHIVSGETVHFHSPFGLQFVPERTKSLLYNNGAEFAYYSGEDYESDARMVPILFSDYFTVIVFDKDTKKSTILKSDDGDLKISYRPSGQKEKFNPFSKISQIEQQLIDIKIEYKGRSIIDTVFYIYSEENNKRNKRWINRNLPNQCINFNRAIKGVKRPNDNLLLPGNEILWESSKSYTECSVHTEHGHYTYYDFLDIKDYTSDIIPFLIPTMRDGTSAESKGYVIVPVIRPRKTSRMYLDNRMIKEYSNDKISGIPFILRKHFKLRSFTDKGIEERRFDKKAWKEGGYWSLDNKDKYPKKAEIEESNDEFYFATNRRIECKDKSILLLDLGAKTEEAATKAYEFYYWDYTNSPEKLDCYYNVSEKKLTVCLPTLKESAPYIVFQSLANTIETRHYCQPLCGKRTTKIETVVNNCIGPNNIYNRTFNIAKEHKTYFTIFKAIQWPPGSYISRDLWLAEIMLRHVEECEMKLTDTSTDALYRLAEELAYDWIFISDSTWKSACIKIFGKNSENSIRALNIVKEFLKQNPHLDGTSNEREALSTFIDARVTLLNNNQHKPRFVRPMCRADNQYFYGQKFNEFQKRKKFLIEFYSSNSPISTILTRLQPNN